MKKLAKMADEMKEETSVLEGLLSTSDHLESLESLDAAFTTSTGSFRQRHVSDSVDIEVDVPEVVNMPSLESILNEKDEDIISLEDDPDLANLLESQVLSSPLDLDLSSGKKIKKTKHGSVLRHVVLKSVSSQMVSASARVDAGLPTAMAVSSLICIGTSHGVVLVFGAEYGAVTSLGINMECTRLLCGHARGQITMWDLQSGKLLRQITDAHPMGSAVLHVMFTDDPTIAICSDSGGSVFVLSFKRLIGMRTYESTCLFSGSRGEVCTMAPLHLHKGMKEHPLYEQSLLALATLTKVLILTLKPELEVLFTHTLKGPVDSLPLMAWQFAIIQVESKKIIDPVLAFGRGTEIFFYQAHSQGEKQVNFMFLQRCETPYKLVALHWLNPQVIATVDALERVHVIDVRSMEELERIEVFVKQNNFLDAFFFFLSFYDGTAMAVIVFVNCPKTRDTEELRNYFKEMVPIFIKYSLVFFFMPSVRGPYQHYNQQNRLKDVESCLMHLDVTNLDIHQMVKLCWAHGLYDAFFFLYNRGMRDYTTPLEAFERKDFDDKFDGPSGVTRRQYLVNILLDVMVQDTGFTVLEYLANPDDDSRHEERQQALLELWNAGGLKQFDDARILVLAENAKFYRVCEMLYERKRQFSKVLSCYFRDSYREHQVFNYVHYVMSEDVYTDLEREELKEATLNSLQNFLSIDCGKTAHMIVTEFPDILTTVIRQLEGQSTVQYEFLKGVFENKSQTLTRPEDTPDAEVHEKYIELMCKYQPDLVHSYLRNTENYRLEETLAIVRQFNNTYATSYLLEKAGDIHGAFQLLLETLKVKVKVLCDVFEENESPPLNEIRKLTTNIEAVLLGALIPLCQRNSGRLEEADREALWFPLLETVMAPQRKCKDTTSAYFLAFKDQTRHVLNSMMGYISLPAILQKIMQDPTYSTGKFGEIKELILGMLDTYTYESTLLKTTNKLLSGDLHSSLSHLKNQSNQGMTPKSSRCCICHRLYTDDTANGQRDDLLIYR
ncbi:Vacuolar protein sorting-associated protein 8-like [Stylophora pistillata]|uniref:Vacuolar protein sorting-associated protein 8-like n=1 Tax=Stylophora pistillata TaxID=50429 RepID=A0A2B4S1P3_STYPI|nr:Vacuolar protein sorting-associated protein 8-like [Stylophora pistillata]